MRRFASFSACPKAGFSAAGSVAIRFVAFVIAPSLRDR
jgi:hypothetical protein